MSKQLRSLLKNLNRTPTVRPKRISAAKRKSLRDSEPGFQFRIDLLGAKPPIWRRFVVPAGTDLGQLHDIIQIAMGWYDCHLHSFSDGAQAYEPPSPEDFGLSNFGPDPIDESRVLIDQIFDRPNKTIRYDYDFGDGWEHSVKFEKRADAPISRPKILKGRRACPPEDCGGIWGYYNLIEVLADPKHPDHEHLKDWIGDELDPEHFDIDEHNAALAELPQR